MEFIGALGRTEAKRGLTPDNLHALEELFRRTVGDQKEITVEKFKTIVQSKNMFFVERIFRIFDTDKSGTVSLEEFMRVMWCFSRQSPIEKLRYLFEVYDINGDGCIQLSELRDVIRECMKENGLTFSDEEIEELTLMLFEDADTDKSGSISFEKFRAQLERHPGLVENFTMSIESWLLPPAPQPKGSAFKRHWPRKLTWNYVRNNQTSVAFLTGFLIINAALFISRAIEYKNSNGFVIVARACGQCLNFTSAFILLMVLRKSITWLRSMGLAEFLPLDQHLYFHKLTGWFILVYSIVHTAAHAGNLVYDVQYQEKYNETKLINLFFTEPVIGWVGMSAIQTGWILLVVLIVMMVTAQPFVRRNGNFEVFYYVHLLYIVYWIALILHGPNFWKWFVGPGVLFVVEIFIRVMRNIVRKQVYIQKGVLLPSKVTHLVVKRPPNFDFHPGDYLFVNIPTIARNEWHPFTISSAPELDGEIWLHIRGVGGWTNSLYTYFDDMDRTALLSPDLAEDIGSEVNGKADAPPADTAILVAPDSPSSVLCPDTKVDSPDPFPLPQSNKRRVSLGRTFNVSPSPRVSWRSASTRSSSTAEITLRRQHEDVRRYVSDAPQRYNRERHRERDRISAPTRRSVRVSVASKGFRKCSAIILLPTVTEDDDDEGTAKPLPPIKEADTKTKEEAAKEEAENVVVLQQPLRILLDGPYGSPTRHIFRARHAVLIGTGIGVTPFASILQSIVHRYRKSRHTCPNCNNHFVDRLPDPNMKLTKVDFFWLNRQQKAFEWFVSLLGQLEVEQAEFSDEDRFLDIHMYITSALHKTDMKAIGLQMALDLLHEKEKRCLITGLKTRTQPGRPDWNKVFTDIKNQNKGKVTVFFCGPHELGRVLHTKCNEFGFTFRKENF